MPEKMRILVVDDDPSMCETLSDILEDKGYEVTTANDGREAVEKTKQKEFGLVLMDIKMPKMNGVEACKIMRSERPDMKIILMTAYAVEDLVQEALKDETVGIFFKPLDLEKVIQLLQNIREARDGAGLNVSS